MDQKTNRPIDVEALTSEQVQAALQRLEAEKRKRFEARVSAGEIAVVSVRRRTYCGCTPDAANRVSNMAMAPCDNPAETCANHSLITSYSPPWRLWLTASKEETPAGVDGGRLPAGA